MKVLSPLASSSIRCACDVCGFAEVRTDAVFDRGWVLLSECPRCTHRATQPLVAPVQSIRAGVVVTPEAA